MIALESFPEISVQGDREILAILKRAGAEVISGGGAHLPG